MKTLSIVSLHCILLSVGCINVLFCSCVESVSYLRTVVDGSASDSPTESPWNYGCIDGLNGPSHWGKLSPEWAICDQGKSQSPIVIQTGALETSNQLAPLKLFPSGASLQTDTATATIQKNIFKHEFISEVGDIAIIAIFYKYAKNSNPYISQYFKYLPQLKNENVFTNITVPVHLAQEDLYPYYLYKGSLARPPCTEGVTWIIAQNVKLLSQAQVEALKSITKGNSNRPAQPVNGRKVFVPAY
ncbi:hypothetical protein O6H91_04G112900 [Diphasiastrum complanatum]|uniref:Uncharacterized protein n=1 Tax=Diphasiastrum complanatum TaxID=34168 RepID=A0ACC2E1F1_DIPCM|nr:hypothetical protein O6H91_04G112900 [Diphasiastrum complanatum]